MKKVWKNYKQFFFISLLSILLILVLFEVSLIDKIVLSKTDNILSQSINQNVKNNNNDLNNLNLQQQQETLSNIEVHPSCGQVVQGDVKLISNLVCNGDGLIVGDKGSRINLNGFSIKGPGFNSNKVGIMIGGQENTIIFGNGVISGFQSGIYISGSNHVSTKDVNLNNNKVGVYLTGAKYSTIIDNMINNNTIGIASHSTNKTDIKYNQIGKNNLSGITFINTADSNIYGNNILNTTNGIFLDPQSSFNNINFNNVFNNVIDLNNANSLPININNNHYSDNNCITSLPSGLCIGR